MSERYKDLGLDDDDDDKGEDKKTSCERQYKI
jgi:hypothetical protein